jgi:hypothetical protein
VDPENLYVFLTRSLHDNEQGHQFDQLIAADDLDGFTVPDLVDFYRTHRP